MLWIGRQMKVGKQNLAFPQHRTLWCLWFLDLYDHVCAKSLSRVICDRRTCCAVIFIGCPDAFTGEGLNDYPVALCGYFPDTGRCESDPVFMIFYLFRHTDQHDCPRQIGTVESGFFW